MVSFFFILDFFVGGICRGRVRLGLWLDGFVFRFRFRFLGFVISVTWRFLRFGYDRVSGVVFRGCGAGTVMYVRCLT